MASVNSYCTIILDYLVVRDKNIISVKLRCLYPTFSLVTLVRGVGGKLSRLVYLAPRQGFRSGSVISQFLLHHNLGIFSCKRYKHYFSQTEMFTSNIQFGYSSEGWGASCPGWFILPPAQDLGQTVSSVNSYCTITLDYLVVRDINIISAKLRCLHPTFSLLTLVRGVGGQAVQAGLSCPHQGFRSGSVICQFLLHHNLGIFSCKRYKHYFSQTEMFTSNIQFGYLSEGWGASCPGWFILPPAQDLGQTVIIS